MRFGLDLGVFVVAMAAGVGSGVASGVAAHSAGAEEPRRPNVVMMVVDDLGWADLGCYGSPFYETPHIDRLAREGLRFTSAYAAGSVCSPTRASIMTGRHPVRVDITDWIPGQNADRLEDARFQQIEDRDALALEEFTLAELLRGSGYQTYFVGKWHLGDEGALPTDQGFDVNIGGYNAGSPQGGYYSPFKNPYLPDQHEGEYLTERLTNESLRCIHGRDPERPFFLSLCYYNVHTPIQPYQKRVDHFRAIANRLSGPTPTKPEHAGTTRRRQDNADYASMVSAVDESVGQIMSALEQAGIADNTIVLLTSDNGGLSTLRQMGPTSNDPWRAGKGWLYEGGIRVPLIVRLPSMYEKGEPAESRVFDTPVCSTDFFPTLAELTGSEIPAGLMLDGVSFASLRESDESDTRSFYWHYPHYHGSTWTPGAAIRRGRWKLIEFYHWGTVELYDLQEDPREEEDLAADHPVLVSELREQLAGWQAAMGAKMPQPKVRDE